MRDPAEATYVANGGVSRLNETPTARMATTVCIVSYGGVTGISQHPARPSDPQEALQRRDPAEGVPRKLRHGWETTTLAGRAS